ncbi:MAG: hypothetical protein PHF67_03295 [Candidatus Nanoarchaeia archaeon]|nr:hypothetical protein [Candidatus Nanoarchaeia archaeon]
MIKRGIGLLSVLILCVLFLNVFVSAEAIGIETKKINDDEFNFKITLYDDNKNKIDGELGYVVQDFHANIVQEGNINSGEGINFKLPKNPYQGPWKINAHYKNTETNELFNVGDVKRASIILNGDSLIIENTGNVVYDKKILITIGNEDQTANIFLNIGQTKTIKISAPVGEYTIKVDDGENQVTEKGVSLTGTVVGLRSIAPGNFWSRYVVVLFLLALFLAFVIVNAFKLNNLFSNKSGKIKKRKR